MEPYVEAVLEPDEHIQAQARSTSAVLAVTTRRVVVADPNRVALAIPFGSVRRVQFDIERRRPATLVIVPEEAHHEPQVLAIMPQDYQAAAEAIVALGHAFYPIEDGNADKAAGEIGRGERI